MFILIIDTTYSHNYRCVYVVYPNMITIPGATRSLISGGGGYARDGKYYTLPPASGEAPFFESVKRKMMRNPQDYKKYIVINK